LNFIYFHSADLDGHCSGAIAYHYLLNNKHISPEEIMLKPINYGKPFKYDEISTNDVVYMLDFAIQPNADMKKLNSMCNLIWIDHHKTAIDALEGYHIKGIRDSNKAACELTWGWFYQYSSEENYGVSLLGRYDVWDKESTLGWEDNITPLQYGARTYDTFPSNQPFWGEFLFTEGFVDKLLEHGRLIKIYQDKSDAMYVKGYAFETEFMGYKCLALNRGGTSSKIFDSIWDETKHDIMMPFSVLPAGGWTVSLYTTKDIDCSALAKKFGGGGHKQASGFQVDVLPFKLPERSIE